MNMIFIFIYLLSKPATQQPGNQPNININMKLEKLECKWKGIPGLTKDKKIAFIRDANEQENSFQQKKKKTQMKSNKWNFHSLGDPIRSVANNTDESENENESNSKWKLWAVIGLAKLLQITSFNKHIYTNTHTHTHRHSCRNIFMKSAFH